MNLDAALTRVADGPIPPEAGLESPPWFAVLDPDPDGDNTLDASFPIVVTFDVRGSATANWTLEIGRGIEPAESPVNEYTAIASGSIAVPFGHGPGLTRPGAVLATIPATAIAAAAFPTKVAAAGHFSAPPVAVGPPIQGDADVPSNEFAFTLRLRVTDPSDPETSARTARRCSCTTTRRWSRAGRSSSTSAARARSRWPTSTATIGSR